MLCHIRPSYHTVSVPFVHGTYTGQTTATCSHQHNLYAGYKYRDKNKHTKTWKQGKKKHQLQKPYWTQTRRTIAIQSQIIQGSCIIYIYMYFQNCDNFCASYQIICNYVKKKRKETHFLQTTNCTAVKASHKI